jgi:Reverse transcriptase (RNA-dependent DNA polymerase)
MNKVLKTLIYTSVLVYLDDVICWADSLQEMEDVLTIVITSLDSAGLKLNGEKSCFLTRKVEVLGHWIESGLIKPNYGKLNWLQLDCRTVTQVKSLIGALSYFRKFVPKFSDVIRPILDL